MTSVTKLKASLGKAMAGGPGGLAEAGLANAVPHRRSLPTRIDTITVEDRLRSVDEAAVQAIAESMEQRGQFYPVQVATIEPGRFRLIAGAHRVAAARTLGWTHIEAFLVDDLEDEEVTLLEIDENLCRAELSPIDKSHFFARRKEIYQRLFPETMRGGDHKSLKYHDNFKAPKWRFDPDGQNSSQPRALSFAHDTAASTPWSPRTIQRYTRIGERLDPALREALAATPIGRRTLDLERMADMTPAAQRDVLDRLTRTDRPPASLSALMSDRKESAPPRKSNPDRLTALWAKTSGDGRRRFLMRLWADASEEEREEVRDWLAARQDRS